MNVLKLSLCTALASVALGGAAFAETAPTWSVNAAVTSDYVFRGYSQTGTYDPAVQGGLDVGMGIGYAGVWASNVKFGNGTDAEVDLYGGIKPAAAGFNFDFGAIYYLYPGAPSSSSLAYADENYLELKAAVTHAVGPVTLGVAAYWSPDFTFTPGVDADGLYYEANASFAPADKWTISGALGHQHIDGPFTDYTTWNAGVSWNFMPHLTIDGRYWDTDKHSVFGDYGDSRVVATLKVTYP